MTVGLMTLLLALSAAPQVNVTGKWEGAITTRTDDGSTRSSPALLILEQKDNAVTGTVGEHETDRHPIVSASVDGDKLKIHAKNANNSREYHLELTVTGDEMKGSITSGSRSAQFSAKKKKE